MLASDLSNPPSVLIHLHLRKTGGTSLNSAIKHAFRADEVFELYAQGGCDENSALNIASLDDVSGALTKFGLDRVRYISGHVPYGVHHLFGSRAKYFTIVRDPVERVISNFFDFSKSRRSRFFCMDGKPLSFEEYVETRSDVHLNNYQVRVLSGSAEFESVRSRSGPRELIFGPAVEARHLNQAKHNIEESFLAAAPLERLTESVLMLRIIYGWPMRRLHNEYKHKNLDRPQIDRIPTSLIKKIEDSNQYDLELYQWAKYHFAAKGMLFEPRLSNDLKRFRGINRILASFGKYLPHNIRKQLAAAILHGRGISFGDCKAKL
jgi:Sulfotransferase family